ncbi:MAG: YebC/PmpR family DNA-binding transcriptional regulator [Patescibacteria group bacterium]|nr:YebC/PmpR family DNA-binding transcriptional regulator [Patescibacteria group bacterium]
MSGHSKWATTKRQKAVTDSKRANVFTKLGRAITVAAREKGGNPDSNFTLRLAIDRARAANMPKENIERAVKRGTGEIKEGAEIEELIYEGFGPGGTAIIIKCLSDNKNRTASDIKHVLNAHGGQLAGKNAVAWQFELKGVIRIANEKIVDKNLDELELQLIDLGAQEMAKEEDSLVVYTKMEDLQKVSKGIEGLGFSADYAEIEYVPKEWISLDEEKTKKNEALFEALDEMEDVDNYYSNLK